MDTDRIEHLLMDISAGQRGAFRDLFDEAAPAMAARLALRGVPMAQAETALVEAFAQIWEGEYSVPLRPEQSLSDWLGALAEAQITRPSGPQTQARPLAITDAVWAKVAKRAYPESWRNLLRRSDVVFGIIGAVVWALIMRFIVA